MVDRLVLGTSAFERAGSSPTAPRRYPSGQRRKTVNLLRKLRGFESYPPENSLYSNTWLTAKILIPYFLIRFFETFEFDSGSE